MQHQSIEFIKNEKIIDDDHEVVSWLEIKAGEHTIKFVDMDDKSVCVKIEHKSQSICVGDAEKSQLVGFANWIRRLFKPPKEDLQSKR